MPIYEYECPQCGRFEVVQKASEKPLKAKPDCDCKTCPKRAVRVISAAAFHLKGGGWYKTDYASSNKANGSHGKSSNTASDGSEKTETSSSETKSDSTSKTESKPNSSETES